MVRAVFWKQTDLTTRSNKFKMFYARAAGRMHGLKSGSCRIWQLTDLPRAQTNSKCFMRTPRDAYPGAQTCCASPTRTPARLANSRRTWSRRRTRKSMCVPAVEKFCRASSAGGRRNLLTNFFNWIVSVAEDCLSPAGSFHG